MGAGIVAMHFIALQAWHIEGRLEWNAYGMIVTLVLGLGLERRSPSTAPTAR